MNELTSTAATALIWLVALVIDVWREPTMTVTSNMTREEVRDRILRLLARDTYSREELSERLFGAGPVASDVRAALSDLIASEAIESEEVFRDGTPTIVYHKVRGRTYRPVPQVVEVPYP